MVDQSQAVLSCQPSTVQCNWLFMRTREEPCAELWRCLQITDHIVKLAKKGMLPSQIGVVLRDSHGVTQVNAVTGSKILRILKSQGLAPDIPEDLYHLIKKAVAMRKHLEANRKDRDSKFRLILVESRIHRLARYYKVPRACCTSCMHANAGTCMHACGQSACRPVILVWWHAVPDQQRV